MQQEYVGRIAVDCGRVCDGANACRNRCRTFVADNTGNVREAVLNKGCVSVTSWKEKAPKLNVYGAFRG